MKPQQTPMSMDVLRLQSAMAHMGMSAAFLLQLNEAMGIAGLSKADQHYVTGPVIIQPGGGWEKDIPPFIPKQVRAQRLEIVYGFRPWICAPAEICCALYAPGLEAPLPEGLGRLFIWASMTCMAYEQRVSLAQYLEQNPATASIQCPTDDQVLNDATATVNREYAELASTIRRRVEAHKGKIPAR
jgi:hypothetical protein